MFDLLTLSVVSKGAGNAKELQNSNRMCFGMADARLSSPIVEKTFSMYYYNFKLTVLIGQAINTVIQLMIFPANQSHFSMNL